MSGTLANTGSIVSPLVGMTTELHPSLPFFFYGAVPMTVCPIIVLLPETIGQPLPNTVLDLERRWAAPSLILPTLRVIRSSQLLDPAPFDKTGQTQEIAGTYQGPFS